MKLQGCGIILSFLSSLFMSRTVHGHSDIFADNLPSREDGHTAFKSIQGRSSNVSVSTGSSSLPLATGNRPVYLVMHVRLTASQIFPPTYEKLFPVYASLHFNATPTDGPLEIEVANENGQDLLRVTDWGLENADKPMGVPQPGYLTDFFELFGKSNATNDQILNVSTGKGLIHDVWSQNTSLALKAYNGIDFMHACIAKLGLGMAPSDNPSAIIPSRIALAQTYWRNIWVAEKVVSNYPVWLETLKGWGSQVEKSRTEFNWRIGSDPSTGMVHSRPVPSDSINANSSGSLVDNGISDLAAPEISETYQASNETLQTAPDFQFIYAQPPNTDKLQQRDTTVADQYLVHNPGEEYPVALGVKLEDGSNNIVMRPAQAAPDVESSGGGSGTNLGIEAPVVENDVLSPSNRITNAIASRIAEKPFTTLARGVGGVTGAVGALAIIITDFTKPQEKNAILCGIFSMITLIGGLFAYLAPLALADVMIVASIIVGEIPNFTQSSESSNQAPPNFAAPAHQPVSATGRWKRGDTAPTPPLRTDVQGILQYTIVGDRNKTGNEKCISKGYKDCTFVYGPYILAAAFQIEPFDAFALLIHYNEGYPMAMTDLVKAFTLSTDPGSANQVATIDCSHSTKPNDRFSWSNPNTATVLKECDKPKFSINRQLVNLPILNQKADAIHDRLMPAGNCTLVGDVTGGEKYAAYNLTITGGAVAIACGIVGAIDVNGTASPLPGIPPLPATQNISLSLTNPGNQSSDGSSGRAYLAPPPVTPFQLTLNLTNSVCMGASDGSKLCFPNGTYSSQDGGLGFDTTKANTLTLPIDSSVVITESAQARSKGIYAHAPAPPPTYVDHTVKYSTNQSATDTSFAGDMQNMIKFKKDNTFTVNVPTEPDAACFYQQPFGKGDFACFGPGGGDLPSGLKGKVMSVKAFGRASVEIFANSYGNSFVHIIDTYENDLSQLTYDKQSSFADVATSIWVYLEPGPLIPTDTKASAPKSSSSGHP